MSYNNGTMRLWRCKECHRVCGYIYGDKDGMKDYCRHTARYRAQNETYKFKELMNVSV